MTGDRIEQAKQMNDLTQRLFKKKISDSQYRFEAGKIKVLA